MNIRPAEPTDAPPIADIYNHYIATSHSTSELEPIDASQMLARINESLSAGHPFLVAEDNGDNRLRIRPKIQTTGGVC